MDDLFGGPLMYMGLGALTHVEGSDGELTLALSVSVLDKIYRGEIQQWSHPDIQAINNAELPAKPIAPVFQQGSTEDNLVFTSFMAKHSDTTRSEERRVGKEGVRTCRSRW